MIDEELLQELLAKASSLYNNGDYKGAIEVWNEVLHDDPSNSKAREGIQMSHLLIGDLEPGSEGGGDQQPADGGEPANVALTPQEVEARLDEGVARVKSLLAERRFPEALEGARSLVPIDPDSEDVQRLIEEAQQSFESAPFIEEHLTLARELMAQERHDEAEAECGKVFALDRSNLEAADLLRQMQRAVPPAADTPAPPEEEAPPASAGDADDIELIDISETSTPAVDDGASSGDEATEPEIVEAKEVVAPSSRTIPASDEDESAKERLLGDASLEAPPSTTASAGKAAPAGSAGEERKPADWEVELAQLNLEEEEKDLLGESPPAEEPAAVDPAADTGIDADLMSLLDEEFAGSEGAPVTGGEPDPGAPEVIPLAPPAESQGEAVREDGGPPAVSEIPAAPAMSEMAPSPAAPPLEQPVEEMPAESVDEVAPEREPAPTRRVPAEPIQGEGRSSIPMYFALLGLVILLTSGAAWWFLFRPSAAGAKGNPGGTAAPPAGSSASPPASADAGPIPTPIGGSSRKPVQQPVGDEAAAATVPLVEVVTEPPPRVDTRAATELSPQEVKRRIAGHVSRGRRLLAREDWQGVKKEMRAAMALDPFNLQVRDLADRAQAKIDEQERLLREFGEVRRMFEGKDYQGALWKLYRMPRDPALGNVDRYIRNAWYNWAAVSMKGGNNGDTLEKVGEALATDPQDADARKLRGFAERYEARAKDNLYYAFADAIELRSIDQK